MELTPKFEDASIALVAKAKDVSWVGENAAFEMIQTGNGTKVPDGDVTFEGYVARYEIDALPKVHDDEVNYELEYKVTVKGTTRRSKQKYEVWPRMYEIEGVLEDGTTAAKYCAFDVSGGNNRGKVTLGADGKGDYEPAEPGAAPRFEVRSPYELVSWDSDTGRKRKATVKRMDYTAAFWSPHWADVPSGLKFTSTNAASGHGFYQTVNLDGADALWYGTSIRFKVGADGDKNLAGDQRKGHKDDEIHVKVEFDANNSDRNDDPKPGVKQTLGGTLVEAHTTRVQTFTVALGDNGEGAEFEVVLGHAGCDKVVVSIGVTNACQDASYEIETRRRVFYQVTRNGGQDNPDVTRSETALEEVGVRLSRYKVRSLGPTDVAPNGVSWINGAYWGGGGNRLNVGNYNSAHYHGMWTSRAPNNKVVSPRLHVLYTDVQYDSYDPLATGSRKDYVSIGNIDLTDTDEVDWSDGTRVVGHRVKENMADEGLFDTRLYDGSNPFVRGTWEVVGEATNGAFSAGDLWMSTDHYTVKLPAACAAHLTAGKTIKIRSLFIARARGPYLGEASNGRILCVVSEPVDDINDTLTHEVGHVIGLAPTVAPPGLNLASHDRRYIGNGHQGPHCAKGMDPGDYNNGAGAPPPSAYHNDFTGAAECTCVMYGEGNSPHCTGRFCDLCKPFGKAGKVT